MKPDFGCHANTRFSPSNFTLEILNSKEEGLLPFNSNVADFVVENPVCRAGS